MTRCPKSIGNNVFHPMFWGHLGFQNGRHVPPNFIITVMSYEVCFGGNTHIYHGKKLKTHNFNFLEVMNGDHLGFQNGCDEQTNFCCINQS